jgi:hypothetical protein
VTPADHLNLELVIRNSGKAIVLIPALPNERWKAGNHNQKGMELDLRMTSADQSMYVAIPLGTALGSSSIAGSYFSLAPGDTVVIRTSCDLKQSERWVALGTPSTKVRLSVVVSKTRWDEDRFAADLSAIGMSSDGPELQWEPGR